MARLAMSPARRWISWRALVSILVAGVFLAAGVTAFWELLQPYAHTPIVLTLIVFGMALASHFLMLLLLDPKSKRGISLPTSHWWAAVLDELGRISATLPDLAGGADRVGDCDWRLRPCVNSTPDPHSLRRE